MHNLEDRPPFMIGMQSVPAGTTLTIEKIWSEAHWLYVALSLDEQNTFDYSVQAIVQREDKWFALLSLPPRFVNDDWASHGDQIYRGNWLVEVTSGRTVTPVAQSEEQVMFDWQSVDLLQEAEKCFGTIACWNEIEDSMFS